MNNKNLDFKLFDADKVSKNITKVVFIIFIIFIAIIVIFASILGNSFMPYDINNTNTVEFVIEDGWGTSKVIDELYNKHLIKNANLVKIYLKITSNKDVVKKGTYKLSPSMTVEEILEKIVSGDSLENETVSLQLIEGKRLTDYANTIATTFNFKYEDVINKTKDKTYLQELINKYWFITDDILQDEIYYPLEGYIYPDTYNIKKTATIEEIFETIFNEMNDKLSGYKTKIESSNSSVHSLLTLASMVELEAVTSEDRKVVAGVFINRLKVNMTLGSDVTTYYAVNKKLGDELTVSDNNSCNKYNTRGTCVSGLPVGPICSPSLDSIVASLEPDTSTPYLYFVADKNSKLYFATDYEGHNKNIAYIKSHDLWLN